MNAGSFSLSPGHEAASLWTSVAQVLAARMPTAKHESLVRNTRCLELTASTLRVAATATEIADWANDGHLLAMSQALTKLGEGGLELALVPVEDASTLERDPSHALRTLIVSPANQPSREIAQRLIAKPHACERPLVIHGPSGAGKTHLLHAIAHALGERRDTEPVLLCSAEELSLDLINAIWNDELPAFRARMHGAGAMLVDDTHALNGRDVTQEELVLALQALGERGVPVVLTTSRPPQRVPGLVESLKDQLEGGEQLQLTPPEWETRVAIVLDRIRRWQVEAVPEVAAFLAGKLRTNLVRLDALLTALMASPGGPGTLGELDRVRDVLNDANGQTIRVSPEEVISVVCRHFSVKMRDLRSPSRSPRVTTPRQIAMYLVRRYCGHSYPEIGRRFGRHHTTALHSDRLVRKHIDHNGSLRAAVVLLEKELLRLSEDGG